MMYTTLAAMLALREFSCTYCGKKFTTGDDGDFGWSKKVNELTGVTDLDNDRIRKISLTTTTKADLKVTINMYSNGLRIRGRDKNRWEMRNSHFACQNSRHYHAMNYSYNWNLYQGKYKQLSLISEEIRFKENGKLYKAHIDWVNQITVINDTSEPEENLGKSISKPSILQFHGRSDFMQKVDRLMNFK